MTDTDTVAPEFTRTPPHDHQAEQSVLGSTLLSRAAIEDTDYLTPADFYRPAHETLYAAITSMHGRGEPVDAVTVVSHLLATGQLGAVGGAPYIHDLLAATPTAANADYYARTVRDLAIRRRLIVAGTRVTQLAYSAEGDDTAELVESARAEVDHVTAATRGTAWISDTIDATIDDLDKPADLTPTPWADLDRLIGGWAPGRLYVIGARPGVGKSLVAINVAAHLARSAPVALSSLEMSRPEIDHRVMALLCGVPHDRLSRHALTEQDWDKIARHRDQIAALRLAVDDDASATVTDVVSHARSALRQSEGDRLGAVIVDYLQLMSGAPGGRRHENRQVEVAEFSRRLKVAAKELHAPVLALSQLNRETERRNDRRPTLADLRESGAIEQDADVVMLLHLPDEEDPTRLDLAVMKNRHGPQGTVSLHRDGALARITGRAWTPTAATLSTPPDDRYR